MISFRSYVCFLVLLLFLPWPGRAAEKPDLLVLPGQRIGQVHIGISLEKVQEVLGPPSESDAALGRAGLLYLTLATAKNKTQRFSVHLWKSEQGTNYFVRSLCATSPAFKTKGGLSTASSWEAIWKAFPNLHYVEASTCAESPEGLELYQDEALGIGFGFRLVPGKTPRRECVLLRVSLPQ